MRSFEVTATFPTSLDEVRLARLEDVLPDYLPGVSLAFSQKDPAHVSLIAQAPRSAIALLATFEFILNDLDVEPSGMSYRLLVGDEDPLAA